MGCLAVPLGVAMGCPQVFTCSMLAYFATVCFKFIASSATVNTTKKLKYQLLG